MSLEHLVSLENYVPTIYKGVKEIDALIKSEDYLFDILISIVNKEYARMFIQTCDLAGVEKFEQVLEITANPAIESLEFRKERLITRCNSTLPYTTIWLKVYLNSVLGQHNYELNIDYKEDIIRLYGYLLDYSWSREATNVIQQIKPCNMIFINIPTMIENVGLLYWFDGNTWNASNWNDDNVWYDYKFISSQEVINYDKQPETSDAFQTLLTSLKTVKLNNDDNYRLQFEPTIKDDTIYTEFIVPEDIKLLENVELLDEQDAPLVFTKCYIDTPSGTKVVIRLSCYKGKDL
jgi:hypothetical protein